MITEISYDKDLLGKEVRGTDCVVDSGHKGIIIGFEDNNQFFDYYYIVYVPELDKVVYQLCNDARFINSIEI